MRDAIIIEDLQVWPKDLGKMTWQQATEMAQSLGPGWRLPTIEEFKEVLYPNRKNMPDIVEGEYYWSSSYYYTYAWNFRFTNGTTNNYNKDYTFYVRAVRDVTGEVALDLLLKDF
jgi:hypothetical protein